MFLLREVRVTSDRIVLSHSNYGYNPIILDNFSSSQKNIIKKLEKITKKKIKYYKIDIRNKKKLKKIFNKHNCYLVIHCAGFKAVGESNEKPILYFDNNIGSTISLIECMRESEVFKLIFSSSATVYDDNQQMPLNEKSSTGKTKKSLWYNKVYYRTNFDGSCKN